MSSSSQPGGPPNGSNSEPSGLWAQQSAYPRAGRRRSESVWRRCCFRPGGSRVLDGADRLLFRPGICQVDTDRASVMRCRRSLRVAVGRCCHRCCHPRAASAPGHLPRRLWSLSAAPSPSDCCRSIRRREGVKGGFACTLTRHFHLCSLPCGRSALDTVLEAYHNPAAVWWGAVAPSSVMSPGAGSWSSPGA